jgi:hypothetical protein
MGELKLRVLLSGVELLSGAFAFSHSLLITPVLLFAWPKGPQYPTGKWKGARCRVWVQGSGCIFLSIFHFYIISVGAQHFGAEGMPLC